ncbi:MAG: DUF1963 domain-containing protein [Planctomycetes bacterium]|nr:DUF1963 domain-containing protein [Planctomycetota bacterium]
MKEIFTVGDVTLTFSSDSEISFNDGKMDVALLSKPLRFDERKHADMFLEDEGMFQAGFQLQWIAFPTPEVRRRFSHPNDFHMGHLDECGFAYGLSFFGTVDIGDGIFSMEGLLRREHLGESGGIPVSIRKKFKPGPVLTEHYRFQDLEEALSVDPRYVVNIFLSCEGGPLPETVFSLVHLRELGLHGFSDTHLPDRFDAFPQLKRLTLQGLSVTTLPPTISSLQQLELLEVSGTPLEHLAPEIAHLIGLKWLTVHGELTSVPDELFFLPNAETIDLQYNKLQSLPETVGTSKALTRICLKGNQFKQLPTTLNRIKDVEIEPRVKALYKDITYPSKSTRSIEPHIYTGVTGDEALRRFDAEISKAGLASFRSEILLSARRSVRLTLTDEEDHIRLGNTRFGGTPDLPDSVPYPMTNGKHWIFHAQIELAPIAPFQVYLPRSGLLQFFTEDEEYAKRAKVLYHPSPSQLRTYHHPDPTKFHDSNISAPYHGFKATSALTYSLPCLYRDDERVNDATRRLIEIQDDPQFSEAYRAMGEMLYKEDDTGGEYHHINSYVFTQHESPEERAAEKCGGLSDEWMVLLSLGYGRKTGYCFWDAGTLTYSIHKRDLQIADFSNVFASIESS